MIDNTSVLILRRTNILLLLPNAGQVPPGNSNSNSNSNSSINCSSRSNSNSDIVIA